MTIERENKSVTFLRKEISAIKERVRKLEGEMMDVKGDVAEIKQYSQDILSVLTSTKTWAARVAKIAPWLLSFAVGAGFLNPELAKVLTSVFQ